MKGSKGTNTQGVSGCGKIKDRNITYDREQNE